MELSVIGKRIERVDGSEKVTGRALYVDDLKMAGMKIHPHVQGFHACEKRLFPIYEILGEMEKPIVIHYQDVLRQLSLPFPSVRTLSLKNISENRRSVLRSYSLLSVNLISG